MLLYLWLLEDGLEDQNQIHGSNAAENHPSDKIGSHWDLKDLEAQFL